MKDDLFFTQLFSQSYKNLLDRYWKTDMVKYEEELVKIKGQGFKVMRNSRGEHKVFQR